MKIIGIEGSSFSGKTTLANGLGRHLNVPVIEEYAAYAHPEGFPAFAKNKDELKEQINYFTSLEAQRAKDLRKIDASYEIAIVDRTAASLIAFQATMSGDASGSEFSWDADAMQKSILTQNEAGLVINPDVILVLTAGSREEHDRRVHERGPITTITSLNDWNFSEKIRLKTKESLRTLGAVAVLDCITSSNLNDTIDAAKDLIDWGFDK